MIKGASTVYRYLLGFSVKGRPLHVLYYLLPIVIVFGIKRIIGHAFTGWDTHDLSFVNFVYFRDCLAHGVLPAWNPFIQSGTFFPSIFQVGHFSLFQFPFALLALLISPLLAYEWMIQFVILMGGLGIYVFLRSIDTERSIACLGAVFYVLTTMLPNAGQIWFIFSFAALPWLLVAAQQIVKGRRALTDWPLFGILLGFVYASGYQWLNLINTAIFATYAVYTYRCSDERASLREAGARFILFLLPLLAVHLALILPGLINLRFNYSQFFGDYVSPEPRLRALGGGLQSYQYPNLWVAVLGSINRAATPGGSVPGWTFGAGWMPCLLLFSAVCRKPKFRKEYGFWIAMAVIAILYSSAGKELGALIWRLPLVSSNRWWVLGADYAVISLIVLASTWLNDAFGPASLKATGRCKLYLAIFSGVLVFLLLYLRAPWYAIAILPVAFSVLALDSIVLTRRNQIFAICCLAVLDSLLLTYMLYPRDPVGAKNLSVRARGYPGALAARKVSPVVTDANGRRLGNRREYDYTDSAWYLDKSPFSHGYDPLGSPIYWHIKDSPLVAKIFTASVRMRQEEKVFRAVYSSDANYAAAVVSDILRDPDIPAVDISVPGWAQRPRRTNIEIQHTELRPNEGRVRVQTDGSVLITFNNNYSPGWRAYINGEESRLIRVNHLFMGVELPAAGTYLVQFKFQSKLLIAGLFVSYMGLFAFSILLLMRLARDYAAHLSPAAQG